MCKARLLYHRLNVNLILIAAILAFTNIERASAAETAWELRVNHTSGDIDGSLQTPAGGNPGTTTEKRPTLQELGIDSATTLELNVRLSTKRHRFQLGTERMRQDSTATLQEDLTSQWQFFTAGSEVTADVKTDLWEVSYLHRFFEGSLLGSPIEAQFGAALTWFDFDYQLSTPTSDASADRSYSKLGYRVGAETHWSLSRRVTLEGRLWGPLPVSNTPRLWLADISTVVTLFQGRRSSFALLGGVGFRDLKYQDNQEVPNDIRFRYSPLFRIGAAVSF